MRGYIEASGSPKKGACLLFRHTMATLRLENGADVRFIQAMLGHATLHATTIYTHVAVKKLKEIHSATHPGATLDAAPHGDAENSPGQAPLSGDAGSADAWRHDREEP